MDAAQTILLLSAISVVGIALGKINIKGISFGGSLVFFVAIAAGHFAGKYGVEANVAMMDYVKNFGLVLFVYTLGLQCGPGFFSSLRQGGIKVNMCSMGSVLLSTLCTVGIAVLVGVDAPKAVGLLCGSVTNTPALIAAQQTVLDIDPSAVQQSNDVGSAYAVAYPFSVLGVLLCIIILKCILPGSFAKSVGKAKDKYTFVVEMRVTNPDLFGKTVAQLLGQSGIRFVISRRWHDSAVEIPLSDTVIEKDDRLLVICSPDDEFRLKEYFGEEVDKDWNRSDIDWNLIDRKLVSRSLRVTNKEIVGRDLSELKLRNKFGVNITRIYRSDVVLLPAAGTKLQFGDRLTVVGDEERIKAMSKAVGNEEKKLNDPQLIPLFFGIFIGVLLGSIPVAIPGMSMPVKLGIAGGPIIVGILMGAFGTKLGFNVYTTHSANLMLRQLGITTFFAALGFGVGGNFVETVFCMEGLKMAGLSVIVAMLPFTIMGLFNDKVLKMDFGQNVGLLCGSMTNPNALSYASSELDNNSAAEAYATVYPLTVFFRVFIAQILIIVFW